VNSSCIFVIQLVTLGNVSLYRKKDGKFDICIYPLYNGNCSGSWYLLLYVHEQIFVDYYNFNNS
jgi:hypothetical protein